MYIVAKGYARPDEVQSTGWKLVYVQPMFCLDNHEIILLSQVA